MVREMFLGTKVVPINLHCKTNSSEETLTNYTSVHKAADLDGDGDSWTYSVSFEGY
jgi:hypothetical protein